MEEKRKFKRFEIDLEAKYGVAGAPQRHLCTFIDVSRTGTKIEMPAEAEVSAGSTLRVEFSLPMISSFLATSISVQWSHKFKYDGNTFHMAGGRLDDIYPDTKWQLLEYAYDMWQFVHEENSLQALRPVLAGQWHPDRNGSLTPWDISAHSKKLVWWRCAKRHTWQARICDRAKSRFCPDCRTQGQT